MEGSEGVETGLESRKPESVNKSRQYFLWLSEMPSLECATSKPKKLLELSQTLDYEWLVHNVFDGDEFIQGISS